MRTLIPILFLVACGGSQKTGAADAPESNEGGATAKTLDEHIEEMTALLRDSAETMLAAQGCAGRAEAMNEWLDAHQAEVRATFDELASFPHDEVEARAEKMFGPDHPLSQQIAAAYEECGEDGEFVDAWERITDAFDPPWETDDETGEP